MGVSYYQTGETQKAIEFLKKYQDMEGADNYSNYYLGLCYYKLETYREASGYFSKCTEDGEFYEESREYIKKCEGKI
jgi:tetratricopeptide (TPR) repeat protein